MSRYAKAVAAFCATAAGMVATVYADGVVETPEVLIAVLTVIGATAGVYVVPNSQPNP